MPLLKMIPVSGTTTPAGSMSVCVIATTLRSPSTTVWWVVCSTAGGGPSFPRVDGWNRARERSNRSACSAAYSFDSSFSSGRSA